MYRVVWGRDILDKISQIYDRIPTHGQNDLLAAVALIDEMLANDPEAVGESRERSNIRILIEPPVSATFRIDEPQSLVIVAGIRIFIKPD